MSKKLLKTITALMVSSALVFTVSGCTGKKNAGNGKVTLDVGSWPTETQGNYQREMENKKNFEKANANIQIAPNEWKYDVSTYLSMAEAGTLPDIYSISFTEAAKIMDFDYAADLTDYMKQYNLYKKVSDDIMPFISKDNRIYIYPISVYSMGLMLNLNLYEQAGLMNEDGTPKAPQSYEELIDTARIITEKTGKPGFAFPTSSHVGGWHFTELAWSFGTEFMKNKNGKWVAAFDSPECVKALEYIKDLKWKYNVLPASTMIDSTELYKLFGTDQAGMILSQPAMINTPVAQYGMNRDKIGMAAIPAGPVKRVALVGGIFKVIKNGISSDKIDAAFKWLEYEGFTPNMTEAAIETKRAAYQADTDKGFLIGIKDLSIWNESSEVTKENDKLREEFTNVNKNHIKLFNETNDVEYRMEEPVCCQDLYGILDDCIQEVLTNENADCKTVLSKAAKDFQSNFLDYEN